MTVEEAVKELCGGCPKMREIQTHSRDTHMQVVLVEAGKWYVWYFNTNTNALTAGFGSATESDARQDFADKVARGLWF